MTTADKVLLLKQDFVEVYESGYEKGKSEGGADDGSLAALIERTITAIEIPTGITKIGKYAFYECKKLTEAIIPEGVNAIGDYSFASCTYMRKLTIPNTVTSIGTRAFNGSGVDAEIDEVIIPDSVTYIEGSAFFCSGVKKFVVSKNITSIPSGCFQLNLKCTHYDFTRHESVPTLQNANALSSVPTANAKIYVPASLYDEWVVATNWAEYADYIEGVSDVVEPDIVFPDSASEGLAFTAVDGGYEVSGIGECTDTEIVIPSEHEGLPVVSVGRRAFLNCTSITRVVIPNSVTSVGEDAFYGCSNIENINIPDSITSIGDSAFYGLSNKAYTEYENAYYLGNDGNAYVYFQSVKDKTATSLTISNNTKFIGAWACSGASLTGITIPESVIGISNDAFYGCPSLASVTICGTITDMGWPFADCPNLTDIYVPWSEGEVAYAPWGAYNATIHYNSEV